MIDSVIFDCDGTLLDSMPAWHALQERFAQKAGIALNPMLLVRLNANTLPETAAFSIGNAVWVARRKKS